MELHGTITAISRPDLTLDGKTTVVTDDKTSIVQGDLSLPFSALTTGEMIAVQGTPQHDGSILASRIQVAN